MINPLLQPTEPQHPNESLIQHHKDKRERVRLERLLAGLKQRVEVVSLLHSDAADRVQHEQSDVDRLHDTPHARLYLGESFDEALKKEEHEYLSAKIEADGYRMEMELLAVQSQELRAQLTALAPAGPSSPFDQANKPGRQQQNAGLVQVAREIAELESTLHEYREALVWANHSNRFLADTIQLIQEARHSDYRFRDNPTNSLHIKQLDRALSRAVEQAHEAQVTLARFVQELADTDVAVPEELPDGVPFNRPVYIPIDSSQRQSFTGNWKNALKAHQVEVQRAIVNLESTILELQSQLSLQRASQQRIANAVRQASPPPKNQPNSST